MNRFHPGGKLGTRANRWERLSVLAMMLAFGAVLSRLTTPGIVRTSESARQWITERLADDERDQADNGATGGGHGVSGTGDGGEGLALRDTYDLRPSHEPQAHVVFSDTARAQHPERQRVYLRRYGFQRFDGRIWYAGTQTKALLLDADDGVRDGQIVLPGRVFGPEWTYTVITRYPASRLPYIPSLTRIRLPAVLCGDADVFQRPVPAGSSGFSFDATSTFREWQDLASPSPAQMDSTSPFVQLPPGELVDRISRLAEGIADTNMPPSQRVEAILGHFHRSFEYSLTVENPQRLHPLENFLFSEQRGHCQLFASAFVLMLRATRIPTRLAAGYCGGEYDSQQGVCTFFSDDAHAWAEVLVEDHGWVVVDPTPSASPLTPGAPRPPRNGAATPVPQVPRLADAISRSPLFGGTGQTTQRETHFPITLCAGLAFMGCAMLFLISRRLVNRRPARERPFHERRPPSYLRLFLNHFRSKGCPMKRGQTLLEYMDTLRRRQLIGKEFDDLANYVYRVSYMGIPRDRTFEKALRRRVDQLK